MNGAAASGECTVDGTRLALAGSGVRRVFAVDLYRARLFAARPVRHADDLFEAAAPLRLHIEYLWGPVSGARLATAWEAALDKAMPGEARPALDEFLATVVDCRRGDTTQYDLLPDGTVRVEQNGRPLAAIRSRALRRGVLDVLFGAHPVDARLKAQLAPALAARGQAA